jgi:hypothetical protein
MANNKDNTLTDYNRRELVFPRYEVKEILPEFFREEYPKLITLLEEYYEFENSSDSPSRLVDELFISRDITQTDLSLLSFIEDELLLGQSFFEGFQDKRAASKYSNTLFRSKGTKYSIQQFFRTFFGVDPDVVYTKNNVFNVGDHIGSESQKFITNNKLYQKHAILIKISIGESTWRDAYKLFVHPAGTFLGSEIQIVSSVLDSIIAPDVTIEPPPPFAVHSQASFATFASIDNTSLVDDVGTDSDGILSRIRPEIVSMSFDGTSGVTLQQIQDQYGNLREAQIASSPTFDDSSIDLSNEFTFETLDQDRHVFYSSDSDQYLLNLGHLS